MLAAERVRIRSSPIVGDVGRAGEAAHGQALLLEDASEPLGRGQARYDGGRYGQR
ncbi:MAG: hypothetical protein JNK64_15520 [Myxococcales bacterium]|nr:hypothetical protein [Myxococcales bacterium]